MRTDGHLGEMVRVQKHPDHILHYGVYLAFTHTYPQLVSSVLIPVLANNKQRGRKRVSSSTAGSSFLASEQPNYQGTSFFPVIRMAPPLQRGARARAPPYTHRTPVRLHADRFSIPTHKTSDSPQLLARHHFEEVSLSFASYFPLMCLRRILHLRF